MRCSSTQVVCLPTQSGTAEAASLCTQRRCDSSQTSCVQCCGVRTGPEKEEGGCAFVLGLTWGPCDRDGVRGPDPGGADGRGGHTSDSGCGGRPGGQCQDSAGARGLAAQHQQQERVASADRYKHNVQSPNKHQRRCKAQIYVMTVKIIAAR